MKTVLTTGLFVGTQRSSYLFTLWISVLSPILSYAFLLFQRCLWYSYIALCSNPFREGIKEFVAQILPFCWISSCQLSTYHIPSLSSNTLLMLLVIMPSQYCLGPIIMIDYSWFGLFVEPNISWMQGVNVFTENWPVKFCQSDFNTWKLMQPTILIVVAVFGYIEFFGPLLTFLNWLLMTYLPHFNKMFHLLTHQKIHQKDIHG